MNRFWSFLLWWIVLQIPVGVLYGVVDVHPVLRIPINIAAIVTAIYISGRNIRTRSGHEL